MGRVIDPSKGLAELRDIGNLVQLASLGLLPGGFCVIQNGEQPNISSGDVPADIWEEPFERVSTVDTGATYFFSSSSVSDSGFVLMTGLTVNGTGDWVQEDIIFQLNGQTKGQIFPSSGNLPVRPWKLFHLGASENIGTIYVYEDTTVTAGVPDDLTKIKAEIKPGVNVSLMSHFSVPSGKSAILSGAFAFISQAPMADVQVEFKFRLFQRGASRILRVLLNASGHGQFNIPLQTSPPFAERTDFVTKILDVSFPNSAVSSGVEYIVLDNAIWGIEAP